MPRAGSTRLPSITKEIGERAMGSSYARRCHGKRQSNQAAAYHATAQDDTLKRGAEPGKGRKSGNKVDPVRLRRCRWAQEATRSMAPVFSKRANLYTQFILLGFG